MGADAAERYVYDPVPMKDGDSIRSGERVDVIVTVEVKNDYEYLLLEDLKPAGPEAVELISGTPLYARQLKSSRTRSVYQELRDRKVAMFIDKLDQGVWEIRYTLRAEVPGSFHVSWILRTETHNAPPVRGQLPYNARTQAIPVLSDTCRYPTRGVHKILC